MEGWRDSVDSEDCIGFLFLIGLIHFSWSGIIAFIQPLGDSREEIFAL